MNFLVFLVVGGIAGWLAGQLVKGYGFGVVGNVIVGILGAFVAGIVLPMIGVSIGGGMLGHIIHSTIGAAILLFVVKLVKSGK